MFDGRSVAKLDFSRIYYIQSTSRHVIATEYLIFKRLVR